MLLANGNSLIFSLLRNRRSGFSYRGRQEGREGRRDKGKREGRMNDKCGEKEGRNKELKGRSKDGRERKRYKRGKEKREMEERRGGSIGKMGGHKHEDSCRTAVQLDTQSVVFLYTIEWLRCLLLDT